MCVGHEQGQGDDEVDVDGRSGDDAEGAGEGRIVAQRSEKDLRGQTRTLARSGAAAKETEPVKGFHQDGRCESESRWPSRGGGAPRQEGRASCKEARAGRFTARRQELRALKDPDFGGRGGAGPAPGQPGWS